MKSLRDIKEIEHLKTNDRLVQLINGKVNYYRFLCFHPRNENYVILLNCCEQPVRFYCPHMINNFFVDYTREDLVAYRKNYALRVVEDCEQELAELRKGSRQ